MSHVTIRGEHDAIQWPVGSEYADANGGWGMCNTGSGKRVICCLGGIGCDVDHVSMAERHLPIQGGGIRTAQRLPQP